MSSSRVLTLRRRWSLQLLAEGIFREGEWWEGGRGKNPPSLTLPSSRSSRQLADDRPKNRRWLKLLLLDCSTYSNGAGRAERGM